MADEYAMSACGKKVSYILHEQFSRNVVGCIYPWTLWYTNISVLILPSEIVYNSLLHTSLEIKLGFLLRPPEHTYFYNVFVHLFNDESPSQIALLKRYWAKGK